MRPSFLMLLLMPATVPAAFAGTTGPDVTVIEVRELSNPTTAGAFKGYSIGTNSCNVGTKALWWCDESRSDPGSEGECTDAQHPVIAQNLYRLKDGRFQQLGMSWLKHGFLSTNSPNAACGSCAQPEFGGDQLGVGCTDIYGSGLNGSRPLGMRSEVDPTAGTFPYPETSVGAAGVDQLVKVLTDDLTPALNAGALYFAEAHYIAGDDALAGNDLNNASYKPVTVNGSYQISGPNSSTVREKAAIEAWPLADPTVVLVNHDIQAPGSSRVQRFHVARKVTDLGGGMWHYEYAVHNMNSALAARAVTVSFPVATTFANVGSYQIDHHSGEPYTTEDWDSATSATSVRWGTSTWPNNNNANALRWGTMFNFWFDASQPPTNVAFSLSPFTQVLFDDGFEMGDTSAWSAIGP